jgi:hypothetical protein
VQFGVRTDATPGTRTGFSLFPRSETGEIMTRLSWLQRLYWRYLFKPAEERALMLFVLENPIGSILEIGIGSGDRAKRLLPICTKPEGVAQIRYAGLDPFESAPEGTHHLNLKQAHRMLAELGVKAHLIPGDIKSAVSRVAHMILPSDLVIIDGDWASDSDSGRAIEQWLPRLCHASSAIFASSCKGGPLERIPSPANAVDHSSLRRAA